MPDIKLNLAETPIDEQLNKIKTLTPNIAIIEV